MDHSFSTTGAIRQHHQSIRNSLSPSPHSNATTAHHHLYRISPTPIANNILSAAAAITASNYSHYGKNSPITAGANLGNSSVYSTSPQPTAVLNPTNFYRVPTYSVQQPQQQQQYIHQIQSQPRTQPQTCSFATPVVSANPPSQEPAYSTHTKNYTRTGGGQYSHRSNTSKNSGNIRLSPTNLSASSYPTNGLSSYSPQLVENNYRNQHQVYQPQQKPQKSYQQQQQYSSPSSSTGNQPQYLQQQHTPNHTQKPSKQQASISNNPSHQQHNNMNKNRYTNQQQTNINGVVGASAVQTIPNAAGENGNNSTAANVKALIQQVSQQQNVNNNANTATIVTSASNNSPTSASSQNSQQQTQQPQYRIYKRGDSIPGISSPIQITPPSGISESNGGSGDSEPVSNESKQLAGQGDAKNEKENSSGGNNGGSNNNVREGGRNTSTTSRTPLSQIGEIARYHGSNVEYRLINETGPPHAPTFTVLLKVGNEEFRGEGPSIKKAQHAAAVAALEKTTLTRPPPKNNRATRRSFGLAGGGGGGGPPAGVGVGGNKRPNWNLIQLTALAQELQLPLQFVQQPVPILDPFRRGDPPSIVSVHVGDKVFTGEGPNFNAAKNTAVMIALKAMIKVKQEMDMAKMLQAGVDAEEKMMEAENKSPISIVHEMAMKRGLTVQFEVLKEEGPPHMKVFTVKCQVGEMDTVGEGPTKQAAKKTSSELMIAKLKEIPITVPASSQGLNLKAMQRGFLRQNKQQKKKTSIPVVKDLEKQEVSPISRLIQIAHVKKFKEPEFTLISTGTESNVENFLKQITERDRRMLRKKKPIFTIEVTVGPHTCRGTGPNKKAAKKAAAEAAVIALGYAPTEGASQDSADGSSAGDGTAAEQVPTSPPATTGTGKASGKKSTSGGHSDSGKTSGGGSGNAPKLSGARQLAPGIIVLKNENSSPGGTTSSAVAQEMKKVGSLMTPCPSASTREGIDKLAYLSKLLEISVSYSDFPKKNEYLSVVSLTTNPPHVAHGCGKTLEEAQNAVSVQI